MSVPGVILAGGQATRMGGGDKGLLPLAGVPILRRVMDRLAPQAGALALNANGDAGRFAEYGLPVLPDSIAGFPPLACGPWRCAMICAQPFRTGCPRW